MTPLHVLACSTGSSRPHRTLQPSSQETSGEISHFCTQFGASAPTEVLGFLVESYKLHHPGYEFQWGDMIETLCGAQVPIGTVQTLVNLQQNSFPGQHCDVHGIV